MKTRTLFLALIAVLLGVWLFASKSDQSSTAIARPNDPWVFRSVRDKHPRIITIPLNAHQWAPYSTDPCSLTTIRPVRSFKAKNLIY